MKLDRDLVQPWKIATLNSGKRSAPNAGPPRGLDAIISAMLLALVVAAIALELPITGEIGDRKSYFASAVDFVVDLGLSIGLAWLLFYIAPHRDNKVTKS
jgi:hypothetical protein